MLIVKKTQICLFVSSLLLLAGCEITDPDSPDPQDTFVKYYGINGTQVGVDLEYDAISGDGESLVILGSVIPSGEIERNIVVRRVDLAGNEVDFVELDFADPNAIDQANDGGDDEPGAILVEDNGFIVVGSSSRDLEGNNPYSVVFIVELDEQLDSVRSMTLERFNADTTEVFDLKGMDVVRASDGTLIITGSSNYEEPGDAVVPRSDDETQILIAKVSLEQDSVYWRRTRGFPGDDEGIYIDQFSSDNFVIIGTSDKERNNGEGRNVILLPTNELASPNDGVAESFLIDGQSDFDDVATAVFKRPNGYVVTGISSKTGADTRPFFMNFTYTSAEAVNLDLGKAIDLGVGQEGNGYGITLGRNGNYMLVGEFLNFTDSEAGSKNSEVLVKQMDQSGNELFSSLRNYGLVSGNDVGEDIVSLPGGDIVVLSTVDFGSGSTLIGLMRLNQDGDIMQ